jgi:aerobic carbon-monoxide dehydrogenase large subunit
MSEVSGWIGRRMPRAEAGRLASGRGRYTDDIAAANVGHVAFLRSPHSHAKIGVIDATAANAAPGVIAVVTGDDLAAVCKPWQTRLALLPGHISPPQWPLARGETCWQGEAVVAVVAESRALAEDAAELIEIEWSELPAVATLESAAAPAAPTTHSAMASNLGLELAVSAGDVDAAFRTAAVVVEHDFIFGRQTGVTLEPRVILAEFDRRMGQLTVHHSHQVPYQMQEVFAAQLGLPLDRVRVVVPDVGGAFGMKLSAYPDELAVAALAVLLRRTVKFTADRLESFVSDIHARDAKVRGRLACDARGNLVAMEVSVRSGFGAYTNYPRGSTGEAVHSIHMPAAPYRLANFRGGARGYFQNKTPTGVLRAVGQPIACTVTEQLIDLAARRLDLDPAELRRRNYAPAGETHARSVGGIILSDLSLERCHDRLLELMDYDRLRREQRELRGRGIYRGVGLAAFIEQSAAGPHIYGSQQVRVSAHDSCRLLLDPAGTVRCATSITDQGQGSRTALVQIIAEELGADPAAIDVVSGDTGTTPFGGGAWASRATALGGEAALRAARKLRQHILAIAGSLLQAEASALSIEAGVIVNAAGLAQMSLADLATAVCYRSHTIPLDQLPSLEIVESFAPRDTPYIAANGIQAAYVEVDPALGTIRVLEFWVVDDCGRVINPLLVDEQIRGGVVQGIGAALYEQCVYGETAQFENASLADYLVPMASEMPDIHVAHVATPTRTTTLGARGVGEAGAVGGAAAIWTAVNDALSPLGATLCSQPFTPDHVLERIAHAREAETPAPT